MIGPEERLEQLGEWPDIEMPFTDEPLECGLENPEICESCQ